MFSYLIFVRNACAELHWWDIFHFLGGSFFAFLVGSYVVKALSFLSVNFVVSWIYSILGLICLGLTIISFSVFYMHSDVVVQVFAFIWTVSMVLVGTYRR